jgi:hypothetical protein
VLYARLWRVSSVTTTPKPLFDLSPTLFTGNAPQIAIGSVTDHDALIQYQGDAIGAGVRPHVLHFLVKDNDRIERAAPVALNPADFVDEWLTRPWSESAQWTDFAGNAGALAKEHKARHLPYISGDVDGKAMRCKHDPTLWQVWFRPSDDKFRPGEPAYFLVRWMPPYRFTLVAIRTRSDPSCNIEESMPDAFGTLFPLQDWRR